MKVIARPMGTGKTRELLELAAENNGQVLTTDKRALKVKAEAYGIDVPIFDIYDLMEDDNYDHDKTIYIHKIEEVALEVLQIPESACGGFSIRMEG